MDCWCSHRVRRWRRSFTRSSDPRSQCAFSGHPPHHYSAAAILEDGEIVAAAQEERFTRKKHDARFPADAVDYCLREAGVSLDGVDYIAFYDKPLLKFERLLETYLSFAPRGFESFSMACTSPNGCARSSSSRISSSVNSRSGDQGRIWRIG